VGSGFGGSMVSHALVSAGLKVLMLERGDWVGRGWHNWEPDGSLELTGSYTTETPYHAHAGGNSDIIGACACVGGPSVFAAGVSFRFRERDFETDLEIAGDSGADWPYSYADLERYYARAERILNVAGEAGGDPTEPNRSAPYPQEPASLSAVSRIINKAALDLGMRPFRLPLAINYVPEDKRSECISCGTCDTFACAIQAKNDLATSVLPELIKRGLQLHTNVVATRLIVEGDRVVSLECQDRGTGEKRRYAARVFVLSGGALGSAHVLLASDLAHLNPGGHTLGHYLMRHCNACVYGFFTRLPEDDRHFQKQLAIHDFYFGHPTIEGLDGRVGSLQQVQTPPLGLMQAKLPAGFHRLLGPVLKRVTGVLVMAEDQPCYENRLAIDRSRLDRFGLPRLLITHRHSERDDAARWALVTKAKQILRRAGARFVYVHKIETFSHAVGTVRMGHDPSSSALDPFCQFRGVANLYVVDGSFMPTSAGLNPSLTIAANSLRAGEHIARTLSKPG
jgi:choline dehydrogenase-like flavoprotein